MRARRFAPSSSFVELLIVGVVHGLPALAGILWLITTITIRAFPLLSNVWWRFRPGVDFTFSFVSFVLSLHVHCSALAFSFASATPLRGIRFSDIVFKTALIAGVG